MCLLYTDALTVGLHSGFAGMLSQTGNFYGNEKQPIKLILLTQQQKINCQIESELQVTISPAVRYRSAMVASAYRRRYQSEQGFVAMRNTEKHMSKRKQLASGSHVQATIEELRADHAFAFEYLKSALEELDDPEHRAVGLLALRNVADAYGGLAAVAQEAGITREALYRALSPTGNPTLKTLLAVLGVVGMRLSVISLESAQFPMQKVPNP